MVRGYLSGSAWKEYKEKGSVCGISLSAGLKESEKLPQPIFTPATKAQTGHDINISEAEMEKMVGKEITKTLKEKSLQIYISASKYAESKEIIIADTKFEFGTFKDEIILVDEILTPDSSRFWPMEEYAEGRAQRSFDKQYVRDYLEHIKWDKNPPAPELPQDIVRKTSYKYFEAYSKITGKGSF